MNLTGGVYMCIHIHMLTKRTNILFDDFTWNTLKQVAVVENTSIGQLVRNAVKNTYLKQQQVDSRQQLMNSIKTLAKNVNTTRINYRKLINDGRK